MVNSFACRVLLIQSGTKALKLQTKERNKMHILWMLIIGGVIGWLAGLIVGRDVPGGVIGNIIAGIVGAWLGGYLLGNWGPEVAGFAIIPAIIGAIVVVLILSAILRGTRRA
jgi:uncharacterized membrane protein YeaQ/YmgE (transglycosylase-associated protein family)